MTSSYRNEIGKILENAREELRLSLSQASSALHIRAHYLQGLETGNLDVLPGAAYIEGYLKVYTTFLHLDKNEIMRRFESVKNDIPEEDLFFPQVFGREKKPSHGIVRNSLIIVFAIYLAWVLVFKPEPSPLYIVEPPPAHLLNNAKTEIDSALFRTCFRIEENLYPPCFYDKNPKNHGDSGLKSVMELPWNK